MSADPLPPGKSGKPLLALAAVTLTLCTVVFALIQIRANRRIEAENQRLRDTRKELLSIIRRGNEDIARLQNQLSDLTSSPPASPAPAAVSAPTAPRNTPRSNTLPYSFTRGLTSRPRVCLTFDGGSLANAADDILDTLLSRNVKATMFLTGEFIRKYPDVVTRIVERGHEVGNHTFRHPHLTSWAQDRTHTTLPGIDEARIGEELLRTNEAFRAVIGRNMAALWRAPYGEINRQISAWAARHGFIHIGWTQGRGWKENLDTNDWTEDENTAGYRTPAEVFTKITTLAAALPHGINGGIILMHLGTARKKTGEQVHRIVGVLIDRLREMGYEFVIVSDMLRESGWEFSGPARVSTTAASWAERVP